MIQALQESKIIAIVRGCYGKQESIRIAEALYRGGIRFMEVTFDHKSADYQKTVDAIAAASEAMGDKMYMGAGTVLTPHQVNLAAAAGAKYIISPDTKPDVIRRTKELGLLSMPGAMTPTEIELAYQSGADFVKVFPVGALGAEYLKAVRAPLGHIPMLAVGGVDNTNIGQFLKSGACGAGVGGKLVRKEWVDAGQYEQITQAAKRLVEIVMEEDS